MWCDLEIFPSVTEIRKGGAGTPAPCMLPIVEKRSIIKGITVSSVGYWFNFECSVNAVKFWVWLEQKYNKPKTNDYSSYHRIHTGS